MASGDVLDEERPFHAGDSGSAGIVVQGEGASSLSPIAAAQICEVDRYWRGLAFALDRWLK
jgi:hypothetical protein